MYAYVCKVGSDRGRSRFWQGEGQPEISVNSGRGWGTLENPPFAHVCLYFAKWELTLVGKVSSWVLIFPSPIYFLPPTTMIILLASLNISTISSCRMQSGCRIPIGDERLLWFSMCVYLSNGALWGGGNERQQPQTWWGTYTDIDNITASCLWSWSCYHNILH